MCRALRVDKVSLAGLRDTLRLLLVEERALARVPALASLSEPLEAVRNRAVGLADAVPDSLGAEVVEVEGRVGGGTYPDTPVASVAVRLRPSGDVKAFARGLRLSDPAVVGRVEDGAILLDMRTVRDADTASLLTVLLAAADASRAS